MNISKLFLGLLILSLAHSPINAQPFGRHTRAIVGLAAAAGAGLVNGVNSMFDSIKIDQINDLKNQVNNLRGMQELNTHLQKVNADLLKNYVPKNEMIIAMAGAAVGAACLALAFSEEIANALFATTATSGKKPEAVEKA